MRFQGKKGDVTRKYITPYEKGLSDPSVIKAENCFYDKGRVVMRPGIKIDMEKVISYNDNTSGYEMSMITTDSYIYYEGEYGRVTITVQDTLARKVLFDLKLVTAKGKVVPLGTIEFSSVDGDVFGAPVSYTVFSGQPRRGKGIYFMVRQQYSGDMEDFVKIYELTKNGWEILVESEFYTPTVLANGRGEGYYTARVNEKPLNLPSPVHPEGRNLLSSRFICCYTTDSESSSFMLPVKGIDDSKLVQCDVMVNGITHSWYIPGGTDSSGVVSVDGYGVIAHCSRSLGRISFKKIDGSEYKFKYEEKLNNLKITASKTVKGAAARLASKTAACKLEGDTYGFKSNVTLFYGGDVCPAEIFWNSPYNPLYFSENNFACLGEQGIGTGKIVVRGNEVLAFKENKIFGADIQKANGGFSGVENSAKNGQDKYELTFLSKCNLDQKPIGSSVCAIGNEIYFTSEEGRVVKVNPSGKAETVLDLPQKIEDGFAVCYKDAYILVSSDTAYLIKGENGKHGLFLWKLPFTLIGGIGYLSDTVFFTAYEEFDIQIIYAAYFTGNEDEIFNDGGVILDTVKSPIEAEFIVAPEALIGKHKLHGLQTFLNCQKNAVLTISDGSGVLCEYTVKPKKEKGFTTLSILADSPAIKLKLCGDFSLKGFAAEYRKLNKL